MHRVSITTHSVETSCIDAGAGRPVLLLHGVPYHSGQWEDVIARLSGDFRCVAPDAPGMGAAPAAPDFDWGLASQAHFVDGVIDALGIDEPVVLVVHDIGGPMGLAWAVEHPEKVSGLVVLNTVFHPEFVWHSYAKVWSRPWLGQLFFWTLPGFVFRRAQRDELGAELGDLHGQRMLDGLDRATTASILRLYQRMVPPGHVDAWTDRMKAVIARGPSEVLWGENDPYIERGFAGKMGVPATRLEGVGHWPMLQAPDEVAAAIRRVAEAGSSRPPSA